MAGGKRGGQGGRGAKPGSHRKGASVGSGGQKRKGLEGRGPTPPASERKGHAGGTAGSARGRSRSLLLVVPVVRLLVGRPAAGGRAAGTGRPAAGRSSAARPRSRRTADHHSTSDSNDST